MGHRNCQYPSFDLAGNPARSEQTSHRLHPGPTKSTTFLSTSGSLNRWGSLHIPRAPSPRIAGGLSYACGSLLTPSRLQATIPNALGCGLGNTPGSAPTYQSAWRAERCTCASSPGCYTSLGCKMLRICHTDQNTLDR